MRSIALILILFVVLISACSPQEAPASPTNTPVPIEELVAEAILATQTAEEESFSPEFPYSPAQLATLLEPGKDLEGLWNPSTVVDITQPIPGYACSGYYGSCWGDWARGISYGTQLFLLYEEERLGEIEFLYFDDLVEVENAYQLFSSNWSEWEENQVNPYDRDPIGEQSLHRARYSELIDEDQSTEENPYWVEHLGVQIVFSRCHGFVKLRIWFPAQTPWSSPENLSVERLKEKETLFDLAYEYMQSVDERITPYACNP